MTRRTTKGIVQTTNGVGRTTVAVGPTTGIDDFEDGDIDEYGGATSDFTVQSATTYDGTAYALEATAGNTGIASTSGLPDYPASSDTFEVFVYLTQSNQGARVTFAAQSENARPDGYILTLGGTNNELVLEKNDSGTRGRIDDSGATYPTGEWLRVLVEWGGSGEITATVYNAAGTFISRVTAIDTTFTSGGIGWEPSGTNSAGAKWDECDFSTDSTDDLIDTFEDQNLTEYTNAVSDFEIQSNTVFSGSYALRSTTNPGKMYSTSGLGTYPTAGTTFEYRAYIETEDVVRAMFGVQDDANHYYVNYRPVDNGLDIWKVSGGNFTEIASTSTGDQPINEWIRGVVDWQTDGTLTHTVYDASGTEIASLSATDQEFVSGGFGFWGNTANIYWDDVKITGY